MRRYQGKDSHPRERTVDKRSAYQLQQQIMEEGGHYLLSREPPRPGSP